MVVPPPAKSTMRRAMREQRDRHVALLGETEKRTLETEAAKHALRVIETKLVELALYLPIGSELSALPLIERLAGQHALSLPHVIGRDDTPRFLRWHPGDALEKGPFGLSQPCAHAHEVEPQLFVTPLLAFDAARNRLGYGAGHYDRAFARYPDARRIGLAWSFQQVTALPVDPWDIPLEAVVTEKGVLQ